MSADTIRVVWRGGQEADVSRDLYRWIEAKVPEAATPEARADLYLIGVKLVRSLSAVGGALIDNAQMLATQRNAASREVADSWDRLMRALQEHPTYRADHHAACERHGVDADSATQYATALREVIDAYRTPLPLPKGGRARSLKMLILVENAALVQGVLGTSEARSAAIVSGIVQHAGGDADAQTVRQTMRNRRL